MTGSMQRRIGMVHIVQIVSYVICIVASFAFYRLGGASPSDFPKVPKWLVKSYTRDIGVPLVAILAMYILSKYHWSLWLCFPLMWGALTTYWKCLNKYFGDTTEDCHWYNYLAHGVVIGLSYIPYSIYTHTLAAVILRSILLGGLMMISSAIFDDVDYEEGFRGGEIVGLLWIL